MGKDLGFISWFMMFWLFWGVFNSKLNVSWTWSLTDGIPYIYFYSSCASDLKSCTEKLSLKRSFFSLNFKKLGVNQVFKNGLFFKAKKIFRTSKFFKFYRLFFCPILNNFPILTWFLFLYIYDIFKQCSIYRWWSISDG